MTGDPLLRLLYLELLFAIHESGGRLPADASELEDLVAIPSEEIAKRLPILEALGRQGRGGIRITDGKISNQRIDETLAEETTFREIRSGLGKASAEARRRKFGSAQPYRTSVRDSPNDRSEGIELLFESPRTEPEPSSSSSSSSSSSLEKLETVSVAADAAPTPPPPAPKKLQEAEKRAELVWRVEETWQAHLAQRRLFYRDETGREPPPPALTAEIRLAITAALKQHDHVLLGAGQREEWRKSSAVRAAGIGLFLDPWCTGRDPRNDSHNGGTRYLESFRPWKHQRGKPDPVPRFSTLYFETRMSAP